MNCSFFKLNDNLRDTASRLSSALSIPTFMEGNSSNVLNGVYFSASIFGVLIKLESNSYDYEDRYNYMISVNKDYLTKVRVNPKVEINLMEIISILICNNLSLEVAQETTEGLKIYNPAP